MKLKIKAIVLYPKDKSKSKRIIPFDVSKVNVITGESHKGKSALIHIIDYCLGSESCSIPVGIIRDTTQWFGLHLISETTELVVLRKEPGTKFSTSEMIMIEQAEPIDIDALMSASRFQTNRDAVVNRFNQLSGLSTERFDLENLKNQFGGAASFRDTSAFQFLPQHIVANPYALFYKADTHEHQQKLKTIFPLLVGAISNEVLSLERELKELDISLKTYQLELNTKNRAVQSWLGNLQSLFLRSVQLGLVKDIPLELNSYTVEQYLFQLSQIVEDFNENPIPAYQSGATVREVEYLENLDAQERDLVNEVAIRKIRLSKLQSLNMSSVQYRQTLESQRRRLEPVSWFNKKLHSNICPFCESVNDNAKKQLETLDEYSKNLEVISRSVNTNDVNLNKEVADVKSEIRDYEFKINKVRDVLREFYTKSKEENERRRTVESLYKFIGRLEEALANVGSTTVDSSIQKSIDKLYQQVSDTNRKLDLIRKSHNKETVLRRISNLMSQYIVMLDIDRPNDPVELDIANLTLKISSTSSNRADYLWEVGSGANWMGYHLSAFFALHEHFLSLENNFVPSFLVIDQPSQVYFPKDVPTISDDIVTFQDFAEKSEDLTQTRKIFSAASACAKRTNFNLQIIIVEHAPEITWQGVENIHMVEEWSGSRALIPIEWIQE
ncbi:DUF3732 domain-containing protein [Dyadobacter pollutisoli]|uniref:DUF3732 domain-containing protein n=1 Tax=Dyadobacter pollutisoli TaxID=2910158 RepID=A0A9E8NDZ8_9BACT|nr:DUF3732 domain-containing protein [Dyadobacter pollutisoli]WAC12414.1 DUF3732 domain-containing protein [Dyadobacter pollutisoli]